MPTTSSKVECTAELRINCESLPHASSRHIATDFERKGGRAVLDQVVSALFLRIITPFDGSLQLLAIIVCIRSTVHLPAVRIHANCGVDFSGWRASDATASIPQLFLASLALWCVSVRKLTNHLYLPSQSKESNYRPK